MPDDRPMTYDIGPLPIPVCRRCKDRTMAVMTLDRGEDVPLCLDCLGMMLELAREDQRQISWMRPWESWRSAIWSEVRCPEQIADGSYSIEKVLALITVEQ